MGGKNSYESTKRYHDKAYDRISLLVKKGYKETVKKHADKLGMSVNGFINEAIQEKIERMNCSERE